MVIMSKTVGDLFREVTEETRMEWRVTDFFSLSDKEGASYCCPSFHFLGKTWNLIMYPNGQSADKIKGFVGVYLHVKHVSTPVTVTCSIGLKAANGKKHKDLNFTRVYEKNEGCGYPTFVKRSELVEKKTTLVPFDVLTITCSVKMDTPPGSVSRTEELSRDMGSLLKDYSLSDVTVRVEAEKFELHRIVLGVRSPVLAAMFRHETEEKKTGVVTIKDCRAVVFRSFARYLYTGILEDLSADNVFDLFKVADKYQVTELADDCVRYMQDTVAVDTFCDAVEIAVNHEKKNLMNKAIDLLSDKMGEILETESWQSFLSKNPLLANEMLQKACKGNKE